MVMKKAPVVGRFFYKLKNSENFQKKRSFDVYFSYFFHTALL